MKRIVVGTAGHIDHGKTSLVRALTGIDCDRLEEEKARGITIDIGFASLMLDDLQVGFVDVPGHERFVRNALAGLGGIDLMALVVAADEGVKPQTVEHLAICSLLEIPAGLVVLSKADLVAPDLLELARLELEETLASGPFDGVPIVAVSSETGEGLEELKETLYEISSSVTREDIARDLPARLPLDRRFHLKGLGVIATGTLARGVIQPGTTLAVQPGGGQARVRNVQVHFETREEARAGERTSLQLSGIELADLHRGLQLNSPGAFEPSSTFLARFELLSDAPDALRGDTEIRFHLSSAEHLGKLRPLEPETIEPGGSGLVEIRLSTSAVPIRGDRFIVRRPSPQTTLGGGTILDPRWHRKRSVDARAKALEALSGSDEDAITFWIGDAAIAGDSAAGLASRFGLHVEAMSKRLEGIESGGAITRLQGVQGPDRWLAPQALGQLEEHVGREVRAYFKTNRLARGMPKAELVRKVFVGDAADIADLVLRGVADRRKIVLEGDLINLPGRGSGLSGSESKLGERIVEAFERGGLTPPSPNEICRQLGSKPQIFEGVLKSLIAGKRLTRLSGGLIVATKTMAILRKQLLATDWDTFKVPQFKDQFGLSRKWAIPLLEQLDVLGATVRRGDERKILRR